MTAYFFFSGAIPRSNGRLSVGRRPPGPLRWDAIRTVKEEEIGPFQEEE